VTDGTSFAAMLITLADVDVNDLTTPVVSAPVVAAEEVIALVGRMWGSVASPVIEAPVVDVPVEVVDTLVVAPVVSTLGLGRSDDI
jgi:hypothetical protein